MRPLLESSLRVSDPIVLLGVWNTTPLETSRWFDSAAIEKLHQLTGVTIRAFTYVKDELHYQGVFARELTELRMALEQHRGPALVS